MFHTQHLTVSGIGERGAVRASTNQSSLFNTSARIADRFTSIGSRNDVPDFDALVVQMIVNACCCQFLNFDFSPGSILL